MYLNNVWRLRSVGFTVVGFALASHAAPTTTATATATATSTATRASASKIEERVMVIAAVGRRQRPPRFLFTPQPQPPIYVGRNVPQSLDSGPLGGKPDPVHIPDMTEVV